MQQTFDQSQIYSQITVGNTLFNCIKYTSESVWKVMKFGYDYLLHPVGKFVIQFCKWVTPLISNMILGIYSWVLVPLWTNILVPFFGFLIDSVVVFIQAVWHFILAPVAKYIWTDVLIPINNCIYWTFYWTFYCVGKAVSLLSNFVWNSVLIPIGNCIEFTVCCIRDAIIAVSVFIWDKILKPAGNCIHWVVCGIFEAITNGIILIWKSVLLPFWNFMCNAVYCLVIHPIQQCLQYTWRRLNYSYQTVTSCIITVCKALWKYAMVPVGNVITIIVTTIIEIFKTVSFAAWNWVIIPVCKVVYLSIYFVIYWPIKQLFTLVYKCLKLIFIKSKQLCSTIVFGCMYPICKIIKQVLTQVGKFFRQVYNSVVKVIVSNLQTLINSVKACLNAIKTVITACIAPVVALVKGIRAVFVRMVNTVTNTIQSILNPIKNAFKSIISGVVGTVVPVFTSIRNTIVSIGSILTFKHRRQSDGMRPLARQSRINQDVIIPI